MAPTHIWARDLRWGIKPETILAAIEGWNGLMPVDKNDDVMDTAMCYRPDGSFKWATYLPPGTELPPTTIEEGEKFYPKVYFGKEKDGRTFFVPMGAAQIGPLVTGKR